MKRLYVLCALLFTVAAPQVFTGGPERQVLQVPDDFATIQQAVDAAVPGDVVMVAPGTYCEQVVITTPDLTLRAAPGVGNQAILRGDCETGGFGIHAHGIDVNRQYSNYAGFACSLMLWGSTNSDNWIVENEVTNSLSVGGAGIMIGRSVQIANVVAQNRVHAHFGPGIVVNPGSYDNVIGQNNATGNGLNNGGVDLKDWSTIPNLWQRNLGTCQPGNAGCD
jgi:hypothetical protein